MTELPPTVFVIEDDSSMRAAVEDWCRPEGCRGGATTHRLCHRGGFIVARGGESLVRSVGLRVRAFASPQEFAESKQSDVPGCLVLDVRLPGMSGLTLHRELLNEGVTLP